MTKNVSAFFCGLLFGLGLIVAQMTNPAKVLAFLDVAGTWDPSLVVVMISALLTLGILQRIIPRNNKTVTQLYTKKTTLNNFGINSKLIMGSMVFGIGWGLTGLCPGPALVNLSSGLSSSYIFVGGMFTGFFVYNGLLSNGNNQRTEDD